jgi:hypothetical protein
MTDPNTALRELSARGITTLEQLVERKARMRKPQRIDSEKALQDILARSAPPDPSFKSKIGPPASSVAIVLDGKRVEYNAIARLNGQPLDYVATTLKGGEQALVVFSDRSIMKDHRLRHFRGSLQAINQDVEKALMAGGLQPSSAVARGIELGGRICVDHFFEGDSTTLAPNDYVPDLTEFDAGLGLFGGDWNDKISSIQMGRCWCQVWEDINEGGASLTFSVDKPELDSIGWNDRISGIWFPFSG